MPLKPRPPGVVWLDASGITTVVRCERCDTNFGPWIEDEPAAERFSRTHRATHEGESAFDWSGYGEEPLVKNPGGRPVVEIKPGCTFAGCGGYARRRGLCEKHYRAQLRAEKKEAA